ncbi:MAG: hypothetical protein LBF09_01370, partial [Odoribacteraceae bacterium]|nr:hypothetical protein [Odoribacteraceae bacterium]
IDSNAPDVLLTAVSGEDVLDFLNDDEAPRDTKKRLRKIIAGMNKTEIAEMNPVLQLLYIKKSGK